jgi:hypothetical protein
VAKVVSDIQIYDIVSNRYFMVAMLWNCEVKISSDRYMPARNKSEYYCIALN